MAESIFALEGVDFAYPEQVPIFQNLDFSLEAGQRVGLFGPTGSGKTSLLRLIVGLETPQAGLIRFQGAPVRGEKAFRALRRAVGFVLQNSDDQLFCPTVLEDVAFGPLNLGCSRDEARDRARETLRDLDLAQLENRLCHRLSGGEKKMVALAGVLAMDPAALLLDEPTGGLDACAVARLTGVLTGISAACLVVSHDRDFLEATADSLRTIADGRLQFL